MHLYWTSLSHFEEGTLSSSLHLQAGSSYPGNYQAGILYKHLWHYTVGRTFSSILGSPQLSSEVTTHPWI